MNLAQVIHQRWAAAAELAALLPAARLFTGLSVDPAMPYAVLTKLSDRPTARFSDGSAIDLVVVRIEVYHESHDAAAAVVHQVKLAFDDTDFALGGSDRVLHMRRANDFETQQPDGAWRMTIELECAVELAAGC